MPGPSPRGDARGGQSALPRPDRRKRACAVAAQRALHISSTMVIAWAAERPFSKRDTGHHPETFSGVTIGERVPLSAYNAQDGPHSKERSGPRRQSCQGRNPAVGPGCPGRQLALSVTGRWPGGPPREADGPLAVGCSLTPTKAPGEAHWIEKLGARLLEQRRPSCRGVCCASILAQNAQRVHACVRVRATCTQCPRLE